MICTKCPICKALMLPKLEPWLRHCSTCKLWVSSLSPATPKTTVNSILIEQKRFAGLKPLREYNYNQILNALSDLMKLKGARILDVGCAYGWFLEAASLRGMLPVGIEPEADIASTVLKQGFDVSMGYFPDCISASDSFDVIIFNDVLEHLLNMDKILNHCHTLLAEDGKLVINIPNSNGVFFKIGCLLARLGYKDPLNRLWQKDYPSPHLIYFNSENLEICVSKYGFDLLHTQKLKTLVLTNLWCRLRMDKTTPILKSVILYVLIILTYPFVVWFAPPDIILHIYERK